MLEKVVKLVDYVNDKDLFTEFSMKKLARRLLFDRSVNIDNEQNLFLKLKERCSLQLISKMEVMVNDYKVSKEIQDKFNNSDNNLKIKFAVTVLKTAVWPFNQFHILSLGYADGTRRNA